MNTHDIETKISLFNQMAEGTKSHLTDILIIVSDGRVPSREDMDNLNMEVDYLRNEYQKIVDYTENLVFEEELPPLGSSINEYTEVLKNSRKKWVTNQISSARETLTKFISVKSMIDEYTKVLKPFQNSAVNLLEKLSESTIDSIIPETEAPKIFLSVLETQNINSADGYKLLEQVSKYYPKQVQWGLVGKQYYYDHIGKEDIVDIDGTNKETELEESREDSIQVQDNNKKEAKKEEESKIVAEMVAVNSDSRKILSHRNDGSFVATPIDSIEDKYISEYVKDESNVLKVVNRTKNGTPSASSFRKEIVKCCKLNSEIRVVLPLLTNLGILTKEQFYLFGVCMDCFDESDRSKNSVDKSIEALILKGYLACFELRVNEEMTAAYCLSNYSYSCLHKESIASQMKGFWALSFGNYKFVYDTEAERERVKNAVKYNAVLLQYIYTMKDLLNRDDYQILMQSIRWKNNHYQVSVVFGGAEFSCYLISEYMDTATIEESNLLLCEDKDIHSMSFNVKNERLFVFQKGDVHQYNLENGILQADNTGNIEFEEALLDEETGEKHIEDSIEGRSTDSEFESKKKEIAKNVEDSKMIWEKNLVNASPENLLKRKDIPSDDEFCATILDILNRNTATKEQLTSSIVQAVLLAKGAGLEKNRPKTKKLSAQLRLATNLLSGEVAYTSENLASVFTNPETENKPMMLAAYLFAMLTPSMAFDYGLRDQTVLFFEHYETYFGELSAFKPLFNKMLMVRDAAAAGFSPAAIALLGSDAESQTFLAELRREATACLTVQAPKTRMKALPVLYSTCFGAGSDLHECMQLIADEKKDSDSLEYVETVLSEYCSNQKDMFMISMDKIEDRLNEEWDKINFKNKFKLEYDARDQALRQFVLRIKIMLPWAEHINNSNKKKQDISRLRALKGDILDLIKEIQKNNVWKKVDNANVLSWMLQYMKVYLNGRSSKLRVYSELLLTGIIGLNDDGTPNIDSTMANIRFYEPWRNALKHIVAKKESAADVKSEILGDNLDANGEDGLKDNLHQLEMLGRLLRSSDEDFIITEGQLKEAVESAEERTTRFMETLELAYTYNQINETEKETLAGIMTKYKGNFYDAKDFACWRRFLEALEEQIREFAAGRKRGLRAKLDSRLQKNAESSLLKEADRLLEEDMNFAVTEEYINRFDTGETELNDEIDLVIHDRDYFGDFLAKSNFDRLYQECRRNNGRALKTFGWNFLEKHLPKEWTSRLRDDSKNMITSWPSRRDTATPMQINTLFTCLGFNVIQSFRVKGRKEEMFQVVVTSTPKSMADYRHPIAAFGTQIKSPINVVILYGNYTEKQLVDTISSLDLGGISIVLIDRPIDAAGRRLIGEIFHTQTSGQNKFLLVDQVLFLYLAMHQVTERLPALLKCTLPYTTYQPFVRDGGSTADEMFCGRTQELATIIDPNGACVVYGGRQLGKTALLERAESRCAKPENKAYAVYTTIIQINSEEEVVTTLVSDIEKKTDGKIKLNSCKTLKDMCDQLSRMFRNKQIVSMHLLVDEVDDFLSAISDEAYRPLQSLVDLKRETKNNFKFVIAGLHNVCRAKNATRQNGIFGQLGTPLCIKPLSPTDALKLLSRPLNYLGFQIDRYPHLETILTNTNYYPGILQFFGYMLVETLTGQYSKYYSATDGNPPFTLQDEQLGAVMNSSDLNKSIKDKFRWSLELDQRYFMIARCITMLYHFFEKDRSSGSWLGFKVDEIMDMVASYEIHCLENESKNGFINLLDEMVEMGILSQPEEGLYRLRRSSFVDIIGENFDALEADIINNNEEV